MKALMLVSTAVSDRVREQVGRGERPCPEYMRLEEEYGIELLDWSRLPLPPGHRSPARSVVHALAAMPRARRFDVIFSDGEHVGVPVAMAMHGLRVDVAHVMIGHHLATPAKQRLFRALRPQRRLDRVVVHSDNQRARIAERLGLDPGLLTVVPYGVDTRFWQDEGGAEEGLVVSAGREHRDYRTLVEALPEGAHLAIADHSLYTPQATRRDPEAWPADVERLALEPAGLRGLYSRASVVVVPVVESTMPAGITTLLEAMAMGKAIVVTETEELRGVVDDGVTGLTVRPGDVAGMSEAVDRLLRSPVLRAELGARAREAAVGKHDVGVYSAALADAMREAAAGPGYQRSRALAS